MPFSFRSSLLLPGLVGVVLSACGGADDSIPLDGAPGVAGTAGAASMAGGAGTNAAGRGGTGGSGAKAGTGGTAGKGGQGGAGTGGSSAGGPPAVAGSGGNDPSGGSAGSPAGTGGSGAGEAGKGGTAGASGGAGGTGGGSGAGGASGTAGVSGKAGNGGSGGSGGSGVAGVGGTGGNVQAGAAGQAGVGASGGTGGGGKGGSGGDPGGCGNDVKEVDEECEGNAFGGPKPSCPAGSSGPISCTNACTVDYSQCQSACGDGGLDAGEECDSKRTRCVSCQIACREGEQRFGKHCYALTQSLSWPNAQAACEAIGGDLVTINNNEENAFVFKLIGGDSSKPINEKAWIGLNDRNNEGKLVWRSGSDAGYRNWRSGEPNAVTPLEDCVAMYLQTGTWNDDECVKSFVAVCEMDPT